MMSTVALDKSVKVGTAEDFGSIAIRVVVLDKRLASAPAPSDADEAPSDAAGDEDIPGTDKRPTSGFLEEPKRGRLVCVFLINGQRQHAWDNHFIMRDLDLKYLRNRMIVVVECDGLKPEAIAELMQGSRHQFYEGHVYSAVESRVLATLKGDPDLRQLEEQAEDEIASLQAGDEAVKHALDQLIESHHEAAVRPAHGHAQSGQESRESDSSGGLEQTEEVIIEGDTGPTGDDPVLEVRPDVATIRLRPNDPRRFVLGSKPAAWWKKVSSVGVTFDPPVKELQVARSALLDGAELMLTFTEPDDFDDDEYPIETTVRASATFEGLQETRILERRVVITRPPQRPPRKPPKPLLDDPTFLKVTSRQPIRLVTGGPDVHVRLRWDGRDDLLAGDPPRWSLKVACESPSIEPLTFPTRPTDGRFEVLIQATAGLTVGEQLKFDVEAIGPGKTLSTAFLADVVEPRAPRRTSAKSRGGAHRRPPYELRYLSESDWTETGQDCFGDPWSAVHPGSFAEPSVRSPLTIFINQDTDLLRTYRDSLLSRKLAETTISQRINKYTAHVAFHLYQMYLRQRETTKNPDTAEDMPSESAMREEIQRVATTLIRLMEVT